MRKLTKAQLNLVSEYGTACQLWRLYQERSFLFLTGENKHLEGWTEESLVYARDMWATEAIKHGFDLGMTNESFEPVMLRHAQKHMRKYPHSHSRYLSMMGINDLEQKIA